MAVISQLLATLVLFSDIFLGVCLLAWLLSLLKTNVFSHLIRPLRKHGLTLSLLVALTSTAGSLYYSEILLYTPCRLCWFQRIFMYPLVLILFIAWLRNDLQVARYVLPMSLIGAMIAGYHYYLQFFDVATSCGVEAVSCSAKYTFQYGYISIPMMALTGFLLILVLLRSSNR